MRIELMSTKISLGEKDGYSSIELFHSTEVLSPFYLRQS